MREITDMDLLTAWERGRTTLPRAAAVLSLLAAAYPEESTESLAALTIGKRDALLLNLREQVFGSKILGISECEACRQPFEVELETSAIRLRGSDVEQQSFHVDHDGFELSIRLPNSLDLVAISNQLSGASSIGAARSALFARLLISAKYHDEIVEADALPEPVILRAESTLSEADPQADIQLQVTCASCARHNTTLFDVASFLWQEVDTWAIRLLREIHELAHAYGWTEADIVGMSAWRRRCYMEMLGV